MRSISENTNDLMYLLRYMVIPSAAIIVSAIVAVFVAFYQVRRNMRFAWVSTFRREMADFFAKLKSLNYPVQREQFFDLQKSSWAVEMLLDYNKEAEKNMRVLIKELVLAHVEPAKYATTAGIRVDQIPEKIANLVLRLEIDSNELIASKS